MLQFFCFCKPCFSFFYGVFYYFPLSAAVGVNSPPPLYLGACVPTRPPFFPSSLLMPDYPSAFRTHAHLLRSTLPYATSTLLHILASKLLSRVRAAAVEKRR